MTEPWWAWLAAGLAVAILEVFVPGYLFVGFALGAILSGLLLWLEIWPALWMAEAFVNRVLVFALLSLVAWLLLRKILGVRKGQIKYWDRDINEN
ncbi:NfeD family protein [Halodurantibacterium flavum]|uniref:NfeD family protein n=1 Tax=Halodurantibacterium flavum TaxID=1382802 RepID=A0ABW4SB92_9RHOB